jgi:hypothetical protein
LQHFWLLISTENLWEDIPDIGCHEIMHALQAAFCQQCIALPVLTGRRFTLLQPIFIRR